MKEVIKHYKNDEITIVWENKKCIHSTLCWKGLVSVFNPKNRPWIDASNADAKTITAQIDKCPSGALSYFYNNTSETPVTINQQMQVEVAENGPLLIFGHMQINHNNQQISLKNNVTALCRCGASQNKPYCDGSHKKIDFKG